MTRQSRCGANKADQTAVRGLQCCRKKEFALQRAVYTAHYVADGVHPNDRAERVAQAT